MTDWQRLAADWHIACAASMRENMEEVMDDPIIYVQFARYAAFHDSCAKQLLALLENQHA